MLFSDIMNLSIEDYGARVNREELLNLLPNIPLDVFEQFFYDHGRNSDFQFQYGHLDINNIKWSEELISTDDLIDINIYNRFNNWVDSVQKKTDKCIIGDYKSIDIRSVICEYWENNNTWMKSPIILSGKVLNYEKKYHLVEGHTRIGVLKGLVKNNLLNIDRKHKVWIGDYI